ncbi:FMN-dependent NADH-azoreductase [Entomoplasma freundtii]|uniref:FMN dependent NADH:quinone oxidoreductase n=1 Tax=Entomoplasma freundtii TaxID=74700 RepID=A0A2K8NT29_9MOLU|nr:FMN-dependent NADH-azoreductase [Entomoplasma freundtii]ATZ16328.1 FMN-dependent NADH-azoreductase [Entomoplasma freundtii]TDY56633.1 FMN-dependent NADH-azoreductase [Entomoplasma freundtii]
MTRVLVINGSPSKREQSYSGAVTDLFLDKYHQLHPHDEIINLDLNDLPLAHQTLDRHNSSSYWKEVLPLIEQLKKVEKVVCVSPMNNFNVSGLMKNYLDHVLLADQTFSYKYSKKGEAIGLLKNLVVQIITTQGAPLGWYPFGNHTAFLEGTWAFMGAKINHPSLLLAGTKVAPLKEQTPEVAAQTLLPEIDKALKTF